jgi:hypothetical protein
MAYKFNHYRDLRTRKVVAVLEHNPINYTYSPGNFPQIRGEGDSLSDALRDLADALETTNQECFQPLGIVRVTK